MQIKMTLGYYLTPVIMAKFKNPEDFLCWRRCGVREHSSTGGESANLYKYFGNHCGNLSENWKSIYLETQIYYSWAYTQRMLSHIESYHKSICSTMLIAALFILTRTGKQHRCPSSEECLKKMWCI